MLKLTLRPLARKQLGMIYSYCHKKWNIAVAEKAIVKIEHTLNLLTRHPHLGNPDPSISNRYPKLRSIVEGSHKIIYFVDEEKQYIVVVSIFDTRQHPDKLINITQ